MMTPAIASRRAFTMIELMVALTIIAILATLLLPLLGVARAAALRMSCASNLRQLGIGTLAYIADHDDLLPEGEAQGITVLHGGTVVAECDGGKASRR